MLYIPTTLINDFNIKAEFLKNKKAIAIENYEAVPVRCREHKQIEIVPSGNYYFDCCVWYDKNMHPRYSFIDCYPDEWTIHEIANFLNSIINKLHPQITKYELNKRVEEYKLSPNVKEIDFPIISDLKLTEETNEEKLFQLLTQHEDIGWREYPLTSVYCKEHNQFELVPSISYFFSIRLFYSIGKHPSFNIAKYLLENKQTIAEINQHHYKFAPDFLRLPPEEFMKEYEKELFVDLNAFNRTYRVKKWFKDKYLNNQFTADDFFQEKNQELRWLILKALKSPEEL